MKRYTEIISSLKEKITNQCMNGMAVMKRKITLKSVSTIVASVMLFSMLIACSTIETPNQSTVDIPEVTNNTQGVSSPTPEATIEPTETPEPAVTPDPYNIDSLVNSFNKLNNNPYYISYEISSDDVNELDETESNFVKYVLIRNGNGNSVLMDNNNNLIYYIDGSFVYFGDSFGYGEDVDILNIASYAIQMATEETAKYYVIDMKDTTGAENSYEYIIDVVGFDQEKEMYGHKSEKFAEAMVDNLKSSTTLAGADPTVSSLNLRFAFIVTDGTVRECGLFGYISEKALGLTEDDWNKCFVLWHLTEAYTIDDWQLSDEWKDFDLNPETNPVMNDESYEKIKELAKTEIAGINDMLIAYFEEQYGSVEDLPEEELEGDSESSSTDENLTSGTQAAN